MGIAPLITASGLDMMFNSLKKPTNGPKIKEVCLKCYYWTHTGHPMRKYKCYCGSCPAKARDDATKQGQLRGRNKRK